MKVLFLIFGLLSVSLYSDVSYADNNDEIALRLRGGSGNGDGLRLLFGLMEVGRALDRNDRRREEERAIRDDSRSHLDDGMIYDEESGVCVHIDDVPYDQRISGQ